MVEEVRHDDGVRFRRQCRVERAAPFFRKFCRGASEMEMIAVSVLAAQFENLVRIFPVHDFSKPPVMFRLTCFRVVAILADAVEIGQITPDPFRAFELVGVLRRIAAGVEQPDELSAFRLDCRNEFAPIPPA